jgi:phosphoribosylanthranilate isomerase
MKIKVCGMKHPQNIQDLIEHNPDFVGFIFYEKSPRYFNGKLQIVNCKLTKKIGVFVNENIEKILETALKHKLDGIQLHGQEIPEDCQKIKEKGFLTIKAFNVENENDFEQTKPYENAVDFFLFDTRLPPAPSERGGVCGGTGVKFDWKILEHYKGEKPFFLSGGIGEHDAEEIKKLHLPKLYAVDINSRFETEPGLKDIEKVKRFIKSLND